MVIKFNDEIPVIINGMFLAKNFNWPHLRHSVIPGDFQVYISC